MYYILNIHDSTLLTFTEWKEMTTSNHLFFNSFFWKGYISMIRVEKPEQAIHNLADIMILKMATNLTSSLQYTEPDHKKLYTQGLKAFNWT